MEYNETRPITDGADTRRSSPAICSEMGTVPFAWEFDKDRKPHACPICGGNGKVPRGFYDQTSGIWSTSYCTPETCRSCDGKGIVWG